MAVHSQADESPPVASRKSQGLQARQSQAGSPARPSQAGGSPKSRKSAAASSSSSPSQKATDRKSIAHHATVPNDAIREFVALNCDQVYPEFLLEILAPSDTFERISVALPLPMPLPQKIRPSTVGAHGLATAPKPAKPKKPAAARKSTKRSVAVPTSEAHHHHDVVSTAGPSPGPPPGPPTGRHVSFHESKLGSHDVTASKSGHSTSASGHHDVWPARSSASSSTAAASTIQHKWKEFRARSKSLESMESETMEWM